MPDQNELDPMHYESQDQIERFVPSSMKPLLVQKLMTGVGISGFRLIFFIISRWRLNFL